VQFERENLVLLEYLLRKKTGSFRLWTLDQINQCGMDHNDTLKETGFGGKWKMFLVWFTGR
jgi:hypothetical protein